MSTKVDTYQGQAMPSRQIAENCRRRGGSGCGGVSRMDAATELTWTYLQRPPQPDPPRQPTECPLLLLPLPSIRQVQGAALQKKTLPYGHRISPLATFALNSSDSTPASFG